MIIYNLYLYIITKACITYTKADILILYMDR